MRSPEYKLIVEKIPIYSFESSYSLKREIRRIVRNRQENEWDLYGLSNSGRHIALHFKKVAMIKESAIKANAFA